MEPGAWKFHLWRHHKSNLSDWAPYRNKIWKKSELSSNRQSNIYFQRKFLLFCTEVLSFPLPLTWRSITFYWPWRSENQLVRILYLRSNVVKTRENCSREWSKGRHKHGDSFLVFYTKIKEAFVASLRWNSRQKEEPFTEGRSKGVSASQWKEIDITQNAERFKNAERFERGIFLDENWTLWNPVGETRRTSLVAKFDM